MLEHGGRLRAAAERYRIPLAEWVDLSTGINPRAYPVPALPPEVWQRLPEANDGLEAAAAAYYGSASLLPVAGSQAAIQALPACFPPGRAGRKVAGRPLSARPSAPRRAGCRQRFRGRRLHLHRARALLFLSSRWPDGPHGFTGLACLSSGGGLYWRYTARPL